MATEDDSSSSQKDDSSIRDSDSGVPPMPLRKIKEISEYDDLSENTDITKTKSKDLVAGTDASAELVGFKENPELKIQMIENEDATRNDLPSLQKRGELLTPKKNPEIDISDESVEEESIQHRNRDGGAKLPLVPDEKDKYSVRVDDALAKLDELDDESVDIDNKDLKRDKFKRELRLDSVSKYKIDSSEKLPIAHNSEEVKEEEDSKKEKDVLGLKAELDKLQIDEKGHAKKSDDDDKSISGSDAGSTVTSPKRVCIVLDFGFSTSSTRLLFAYKSYS